MNTEDLKEHWGEMCTDFKVIEGRGVCAIQRFLFTYGLITGLTETSYAERWCYETHVEAKMALENWDGKGDPPGLWIKHKGNGGDYGNIHHPYFDHRFGVVSPHYIKNRLNG